MATLNLQLSNTAHDADQQSGTNDQGRAYAGSGVVTINRAILQPGSHGLHDEWTIGCWFTGVTIAQGATINSANFILTPQNTWNAGPSVIKYYVSAQAADNAAIFSASAASLNTTNRPRSTATVAWTQTSVTVNVDQSVSITSVVQEIVNRAGWASGNAIAILVDTHEDTTQGEWQDYYSYDGLAGSAAKLQIDYTVGGAAAPKLLMLMGVG